MMSLRGVAWFMSIAAAILFISVMVVLGVLLFLSPGTPKPFLDASGQPLAGSTLEKIRLNINGVGQGMYIKGRNTGNPVLLYLHGGLPDHFRNDRCPTGLDELFTMIWWEQRDCGVSFHPDMAPESLNTEQLVSDRLELTRVLRTRFGPQAIGLAPAGS
jgi:pimeloyl-ACP methyl ester carboxylesterase